MKLLCGFFLVLFGVAVFAEEIPDFLTYKEGQRYFLAPTEDGLLQVVDLEAVEFENRFDAEQDVIFNLYTRSNPTTAQVITYGDLVSLTNSNYVRTKPTKFIAHGWNGNGNSESCTMVRTLFLNTMDVNVICVDWGVGANALYPTAVINVPPVGRFIGKFIDWLVAFNTDISMFHITGHSLGGHVAGIAGRSVTAGKIDYITAFDPAFPLWGESSQRVRPSDGNYVEIIHTNSGNLGLEEPVGHNDYYPNGGKTMPGCGVTGIGCSHARSYEYFAYSLDHTGFMANQCIDYPEISNNQCSNLSRLHMGGASPKDARGIFWLATSDTPPYYLG